MLLGELAALFTAVCWSFTGIFFTAAGRRVSAPVVNLMRLLLAVLIMLVVHRVARGTWVPVDASAGRWGWLALSGVVGLTLGDAALFQAMVTLGARLAMLMMALVPIISTVLAWLFLGEHLRGLDLLAVVLTVGGVAGVVLERRAPATPGSTQHGHYGWGIAFGVLAALGQSVGLILSRRGLDNGYSVVSANVIRLAAACMMAWAVPLVLGRAGAPFAAVRRDRVAALAIVGGTIVGPVLGVMASLLAVQLAPVGIASTLMALTPVIILPLVYFLYRERISSRAMAGTALALAGVALIFLA